MLKSCAANDPPMLLGRVLADRIEKAGVKFAGRVRKTDGVELKGAVELCRTRTPLATVLERANKRSLNMAAECLLLRAGDGTWDGSIRAMTKVLTGTFNLSPDGLVVRDGSGLSSGNRASAGNVARLLAALAKRKDFAAIRLSLPVSGRDGTLRRRLADKLCRGRVRAKTGTLSGATGLSGYVEDADGRAVAAFSILVNGGRNAPAKSLQNRICRMLVKFVDAGTVGQWATPGRRRARTPTTFPARPRSLRPGP